MRLSRYRPPDRATKRQRFGDTPSAMTGLAAALFALWPSRHFLASRPTPPVRSAERSPGTRGDRRRDGNPTESWSAWGSLNPSPTVGDEVAYVLQARLLARGQIAGGPPPIPEFFEQAHVLVAPRLAPKYPLGFALALVPGVLFGATALVPLLLTGLTAALLFVLSRRLYGAAGATLASAVWFAAPGGRYRAGFFSETLTGATCLLAWYGLVRWREERHCAGSCWSRFPSRSRQSPGH